MAELLDIINEEYSDWKFLKNQYYKFISGKTENVKTDNDEEVIE